VDPCIRRKLTDPERTLLDALYARLRASELRLQVIAARHGETV
jgi:hypothetical protein